METGNFALGFPKFGLFLEILPLVGVAFALPQSQFYFDAAAFEIELQADESEAFLQGRLRELEDLVLVQEELAGPLRFVLEPGPGSLPRLDVTTVKPRFVAFDTREGIADIDLAGADRFYLGSTQNKAGLEGLGDNKITAGAFVSGDFGRHGVTEKDYAAASKRPQFSSAARRGA